MKKIGHAIVAAAALGWLALSSSAASALPNGLSPASTAKSTEVQGASWVCGTYHCWWHPDWDGNEQGGQWGGHPWWGHEEGWHHWGWRHWAWRHWAWHHYWGWHHWHHWD